MNIPDTQRNQTMFIIRFILQLFLKRILDSLRERRPAGCWWWKKTGIFGPFATFTIGLEADDIKRVRLESMVYRKEDRECDLSRMECFRLSTRTVCISIIHLDRPVRTIQ
jgi:hypothetical protein